MRRWLPRILMAGLLVAWLLTGVKVVQPGNQAVVRRFGRVLDVQPHAGLWVGLPWPFDRVDIVDLKGQRTVRIGFRPGANADDDAPAGQLLTGDRNLVNVSVAINYTVDIEHVVAFVEQQERSEEILTRVAEATLAEWIGGRTIDSILLKGKTTLPLELAPLLQERLAPLGIGVQVHNVVATPAAPDEVKPAFDQVAEAGAQSSMMVENAKKEANEKEQRAAQEIHDMYQKADAYAQIRPNFARADANKFEARLAAYKANPLVREAGRWEHLLKMVKKLTEQGQLHPLDPALDSPLRP